MIKCVFSDGDEYDSNYHVNIKGDDIGFAMNSQGEVITRDFFTVAKEGKIRGYVNAKSLLYLVIQEESAD